jgi:Flp pilus assembly protein TadB
MKLHITGLASAPVRFAGPVLPRFPGGVTKPSRLTERWNRATGALGYPPARSALGLRLALATFGLLVCAGAVVAFAVAGQPLWIVVFAVLTAVTVVDLTVISRRLRAGRRDPER